MFDARLLRNRHRGNPPSLTGWKPLSVRVAAIALVVAMAPLTVLPPTTHGRGVGLFWATETVEEGGPTGLSTSIALDPAGATHVSYVDRGADAVKYAVLKQGGWEIEVVDVNGGFTGPTNLFLDDQSRPHLSYFNGRAGSVMYAVRNGSSWQRMPVDRGFFPGPNSLAVDSSGIVHLAYGYFNAKLRYARWDGMNWTIEKSVDSESVGVRYVSLALDSEDRPHIAYYGDGSLNYASWTGQRWKLETVDATGNRGLYARLAIDSQDVSHVAYRDAREENLRYARRANGSWSLEIVDSGGDTGWFASIAVGGEGAVHVAYYERLRSELRHARRQPTTWFVERVDSEGVVGWYASLAVDLQGAPHIAYYDWSHGSLKYAAGLLRLAVRTLAAPQLAPAEALLRGELLSLGDFDSARVSFQWRPKGTTLWSSTPAETRVAEGVYETSLRRLNPEQEYEFRAVAENSGAIEVGETLTFATPAVIDEEALRASAQRTLFIIAGLAGFLIVWLLFVVRRRIRERRREKGLLK